VDGGAATSPIFETSRLHSFGSATYDTCVPGGSDQRVDLFWSDPLGASSNDYDLFVLDPTGTTLWSYSNNYQTGTQNPYESVGSLTNGSRIVIVKYNGAARFIHLSTGRARLSISTSGATVGHSAAIDAFSVAAIDQHSAYPNPFTGGAANPFQSFSSDGLRHVFFYADGSAITPGDFSSTGGTIRQKPDIAAADGVSTDVPGFGSFYGTSAAAPHSAAIAALLLSYAPTASPAKVRTILTGTALDVNPLGVDRDTGYGIVMAYQALAAIPTNSLCYSATVASGFEYTNTQSTVYATATGAPSSPSCIYNFGSGVWYQYTAPASGTLEVDTIGSDFDTALGLYSGFCGSLTQLACDDDSGGNLTSKITYPVTAGTTYLILAGGYNSYSGNLVFHLLLNLSGSTVAIDASDTGWYDSTGSHTTGNANYIAGEYGALDYRDYFVFPVPALNGFTIASAELLINSYTNYNSVGSSLALQLNGVTTSIPVLEAGGTGLTGIYNDLGNGTIYGSQAIPVSASGSIVSIPLNAAFVNAAMAAAGGEVAVGGSITSLVGTNQMYLFAFSQGFPGDVRLQLTYAPSAIVNVSDLGWYDDTGYNSPLNTDYFVGHNGTNNYHNFFVFPVPSLGGSIVKAELLVKTYTVISPTGVLTYLLRDASTPIPTLEAGGTGLTGVYNDLGSGAVYAVRDISVSESGMTAIVPLNGDFIAAAEAVRGGQIALGGSVATPTNGEYSFGFSSGNPTDARLRLTFGNQVWLTTTNRGWYDSTGSHFAGNANYVAGEFASNAISYRNFFVFDLPALSGQIVNAQLLLESFTNTSPLGVQSYALHDVTTPIANLLAGGSGLTGIYADLGDGAAYGGRNIYDSEGGTVTAIPLNSLLQNAVVTAPGSRIALGGAITTLAPLPSTSTEDLFAFSNDGFATDTELFLGFMSGNPSSPILVPPFKHFANGQFEFGVSGSASSYEIDVSSDLQNWDVLGTLTMTNPVSIFLDTTASPGPRFYEARFIP